MTVKHLGHMKPRWYLVRNPQGHYFEATRHEVAMWARQHRDGYHWQTQLEAIDQVEANL